MFFLQKEGEKLKAEYDIAMEKYNKENNTDTKPKPAKVAKKSEKPKKVDKPKVWIFSIRSINS